MNIVRDVLPINEMHLLATLGEDCKNLRGLATRFDDFETLAQFENGQMLLQMIEQDNGGHEPLSRHIRDFEIEELTVFGEFRQRLHAFDLVAQSIQQLPIARSSLAEPLAIQPSQSSSELTCTVSCDEDGLDDGPGIEVLGVPVRFAPPSPGPSLEEVSAPLFRPPIIPLHPLSGMRLSEVEAEDVNHSQPQIISDDMVPQEMDQESRFLMPEMATEPPSEFIKPGSRVHDAMHLLYSCMQLLVTTMTIML